MRICLIVVAFYLVLGTIFAKLWRIYYIFRYTSGVLMFQYVS